MKSKFTVEQLEEIFEDVGVMEDGSVELELHTDGGYDMIVCADSLESYDIIEAIKDVDASEEVQLWWHDASYRNNYGNNICNAVNDIEGWKADVLRQVDALLYGEQKTVSKTMYLTVRVDYNCPDGMDEEQAQGLAESLAIKGNFVSVVNGVSLENVEVCGINEEE